MMRRYGRCSSRDGQSSGVRLLPSLNSEAWGALCPTTQVRLTACLLETQPYFPDPGTQSASGATELPEAKWYVKDSYLALAGLDTSSTRSLLQRYKVRIVFAVRAASSK